MSDAVPTPEEVAAEHRARLLANRAARERAAAERQAAHELQCLELEDEWSQKLGPRGQEFEIVNEDNACGEGPIVVKRGEAVKHKAWSSRPGSAPEDMFAYVVESVVYPKRDEFTAITGRRPELLGRCTIALTKLFGFSDAEIKKK